MMIRKFLFISIIICAAFFSQAAYSEVVDKIIVVVNSEVITQGELDMLLVPVYAKYQTTYQGEELIAKMEEARQKILEQLIEDRLIVSEAKRLNVEIENSAVEAKVNEAMKRFGSRASFEEALASQHMSLKDLRANYRQQLMTRRLIDQKVGANIIITPIDVREYYNAHADEFVQQEEVKLSNILIRPTEEMDAEKSLVLAQEILRRLKAGGDFSELAKAHSQGPGASEGGMMGYVKKGNLMPEIENVVFNMKEGDISDVLQTSAGYHIFKLDEKREKRNLALSEASRDIEDIIYREKVKGKIKGWIEGLKKNAYIAFK